MLRPPDAEAPSLGSTVVNQWSIPMVEYRTCRPIRCRNRRRFECRRIHDSETRNRAAAPSAPTKCPKLAMWLTTDGRLALASTDIQLSNVSSGDDAVRQALQQCNDQPDLVVLVETDIAPMPGWALKEGER